MPSSRQNSLENPLKPPKNPFSVILLLSLDALPLPPPHHAIACYCSLSTLHRRCDMPYLVCYCFIEDVPPFSVCYSSSKMFPSQPRHDDMPSPSCYCFILILILHLCCHEDHMLSLPCYCLILMLYLCRHHIILLLHPHASSLLPPHAFSCSFLIFHLCRHHMLSLSCYCFILLRPHAFSCFILMLHLCCDHVLLLLCIDAATTCFLLHAIALL